MFAASAAGLFSTQLASPVRYSGDSSGQVQQSPGLRYAWLGRPCPGQGRTGDAVLVREARGRVLFGIVDSLGEGAEAWRTAMTALSYLRTADVSMGLVSLLRGLHLVLEGSRGAEATLGLLSGSQLFAVRIGGVEMIRTGGEPLNLPPSPGILGRCIDRPRVESFTVAAGQRLVLHSDGLDSGALEPVMQPASQSGHEPASSCQAILTRGFRGEDEGTVLVLDLE